MRQKTPHPKELKAKAHKLFGKKDASPVQHKEDGTNGIHDGEGVPQHMPQADHDEEAEDVNVSVHSA